MRGLVNITVLRRCGIEIVLRRQTALSVTVQRTRLYAIFCLHPAPHSTVYTANNAPIYTPRRMLCDTYRSAALTRATYQQTQYQRTAIELYRITMADEYFEEVTEISLPAKLFRRSIGIAFDVGKYTVSVYLRYIGLLTKRRGKYVVESLYVLIACACMRIEKGTQL